MKFVRCKPITDNGNDVVYVNLQCVKLIMREEREERAAIIETYDGKTYECFHDIICDAKINDCLREI